MEITHCTSLAQARAQAQSPGFKPCLRAWEIYENIALWSSCMSGVPMDSDAGSKPTAHAPDLIQWHNPREKLASAGTIEAFSGEEAADSLRARSMPSGGAWYSAGLELAPGPRQSQYFSFCSLVLRFGFFSGARTNLVLGSSAMELGNRNESDVKRTQGISFNGTGLVLLQVFAVPICTSVILECDLNKSLSRSIHFAVWCPLVLKSRAPSARVLRRGRPSR
ncbi:hypothetical protein B0H10DRAFT_1944336 [Mycena sp. CBHHK59/15]|nr:hypothetical protein B0H10DRAFT_1944336 [Mycena sp. CBHHK59/15]